MLEEWRERDRLNLTETLNSLEGAGGIEGDKYVLLHGFVLFQSSKICWRRERDRINLKETLNSLERAGGMECDKYVLLHSFVLFQSSKICWRNGGTE